MSLELAILCFVGALVGALVVFALHDVARRREVQRSLGRCAPPGAWTRPVVVATPDRTQTTFDAAGVLIVDGSTVVVLLRRLHRLFGTWTRGDGPFERIALDASTRIAGRERLGGVTGLTLEVEGKKLWLAPDPGIVLAGSDEAALDLVPRLEQALALEPAARRAGDPLLRVGSIDRVELWVVMHTLLPALVVAAAAGLLVWGEWLRRSRGGLFGVAPPWWLLLAILVPAAWAVHRLLGAAGVRACSVTIFDDRLVFTRERTTTVAWRDVAGYRDASASVVHLVLRPGALSDGGELAIPTRTEADRTAVLALLDQRGLARVA